MKKHLIAAAVAAAVAVPAAAQVTVTGAIEAGLTSKDIRALGSSTDATRQSGITSGHVTTPQITFRGTEDLGGGMRASFFIQEEFETGTGSTETTNSTTSLSQTYVSLAGGFGEVSVGRMNHATRDVGGVYRFFGDIGRLNGNMNSNNNLTNTIQYVSPRFADIQVSVGFSDAGKAAVSGAATGINTSALATAGVTAKVGMVNLALAREEEKLVGTAAAALRAKSELNTLGMNADMGFARIGLVYAEQDHSTAAGANGGERSALGLHAAIPAGKGVTVGGSFTTYEVSPAAGGAKPKADILAVAARYDFSKRTGLFASYQQVKNSGAENALAADSATGVNNGAAGSSRGLSVVEVTNKTTSGFGLTLVHNF